MNKFGFFALLLLTVGGVSAATVDQVIVRQQWPWSTDIDVEYRVTGVTTPVDITVRAFNGETELDSAKVASALSGDVYGIAESGVGTLTIDPVKAFGSGKVALAEFKVQLGTTASAADERDTLYKVFNLQDGGCTDISRADIKNGKYGSWTLQNGNVVWTEVTNNVTYMTTNLVMRYIKAKNQTFRMGGDGPAVLRTNEVADVTLTNDYYIGVFEVTQAQWTLLAGDALYKASDFTGDCRPRENVGVGDIRTEPYSRMYPAHDCDETALPYMYPNPPHGKSFLGRLRTKTGDVPFDLPSEAQWEFACRAGYSNDYWGNGQTVAARNAQGESRDTKVPGLTADSDPKLTPNGEGSQTAVVGRYAPNDWGLYDMHGNVWEWCMDFRIKVTREDGTTYFTPAPVVSAMLHGAPNANGLHFADPARPDDLPDCRASRGGSWGYRSEYARPFGCSANSSQWTRANSYGFRVYFPVFEN